MARTNALICDRCGRTFHQRERYQLKTRRRFSWASDWEGPFELCPACWKGFITYMDPSCPIMTIVTNRTEESD